MSKRSKTDLWMPVYIGDYLADTMRLSTAQHGAYLLLMLEYWRQGPLPDDADELAAIARADRKTWDKSIWPILKRYFHKEDDGLLHQKRADAERAFADGKRQKRTEAANARWNQSASKGNANASDLDMQENCKGDPTCASRPPASPSPSPSSLRSEDTLTSFVPPDGAGRCPAQTDLLPAALPSAPPQPHNTDADGSQFADEGGMTPEAKSDTPEPSGAKKTPSPAVSATAAGPQPPDARQLLFSTGLLLVRRLTGKPEGAARALIGRWLKTAKDDAALVAAVVGDAADLRPADPIAWIEKALRQRSGSQQDRLAAEWALSGPDMDAEADRFAEEDGF